MTWMLDANIVSAIVRFPDGPAARLYAERISDCCTSIVVAGELRYGIAKRPDSRGASRTAALLETLSVLPFEPTADEHYGRLRAALERKGQPIGANDMLIAAHALALDRVLVTDNEREFRRVPGLAVENWIS